MSEEKEKQNKIKKVFLDDLPHKGKSLDWVNSLNCEFRFIYDNIQGIMKIVGYNSKTHKLTIAYKNYNLVEVCTDSILNNRLGMILRYEIWKYEYDETKSRRVDLRNLPLNANGIDWSKVATNKNIIPFNYDGIVGSIKIIDYDSNSQKITTKYNNRVFKINTGHFICGKLGSLLNIHTSEFKIKIGQTFKDEKRNLVITDKEHRLNYEENGTKERYDKYYKYTCNKCGWTEGWILEKCLLGKDKIGCSCCANKTIVKGINDIATTYPHLVKYFVNIEDTYNHTYGSANKVMVKCLDCGCKKEISIVNFINNEFIMCPKCSDGISYPNKFMFNMLEQLNIEFISEYSPEWIGRKRYDFCIPSMNLIIEMDGGFHKKDNKMSGQTKEESKAIDDYKDLRALENGYEVIRIDCNYQKNRSRFEFIKQNVLNSKLIIVFNLDKINWNKISEFAVSSYVKKICEYKRDNQELTTGDIGAVFNMDRHQVLKYLRQGSEIWNWISYDGKRNKISKIY